MKSLIRVFLAATACGVAGAGSLQLAPAFAQQADNSVTLSEVDIRAFIEDVANVTGRTFIIDPRVTGKVSVVSTRQLSPNELFQVFQSTLRVHGFVASPSGANTYRIIPDEVAAREPGPGPGGGAEADRYVTQVFSLKHAESESVAQAIRPLLSLRGAATSVRRGNSIIVVDYGSTLLRVREVIQTLDRDSTELRTIRLTNTSASEMVRSMQAIITADGGPAVQIVALAAGNTVVMRGEPALLDRYAPLLQELDVQADFRRGVVVIPLTYAVADEVLPILQQISASMEGPAGADGAPAANRRANIASHKATNSLIISADPDVQEALSEVVTSLDKRRQQVNVEAVIVEVSDTAAQELGLQFLVAGGQDNAVPFLSTSYGNSAPNLLAVTGALMTGDQDTSDNPALAQLQQAAVSSLLGSTGGLFGVGGQTDDGAILGLIVNALKEDRDSNVLSTPSVLTLDNESASIMVGQQIPITTGETLGSANTNPFRTIQREDVGVQLEVTPQISDDGVIRLTIRQEVSSIFGPITSTSTDLITNKREINTVVQVDAGQIIVLGGLIQEDVQKTESGIPGLRDIPLVGGLFGSTGESRRRTNLMVFLRPTIVNTPEQAHDVTMRQYQAVQGFDGLDPLIQQKVETDFFNFTTQPPVAPPLPAQSEAATPPATQ